MTALSLQHLAHGVQTVTAATETEAWLIAVGVDAGFISLEFALLFASTDLIRHKIEGCANSAIVGTFTASAAFNAFAFCAKIPADAIWYLYTPPIALGVAVPTLIYVLVKIGTTLFLTPIPQRG